MSATCCRLVCVRVVASVDWVFLLRAHALSAVKWSVWLWQPFLAWRETWLAATTAWERCLTESSNSLLMLVHIHTDSKTRFIFCSFCFDDLCHLMSPPIPLSLYWPIRSTSCLINLCHLCSRQLGWPEIGLMLVGSGKIRRNTYCCFCSWENLQKL